MKKTAESSRTHFLATMQKVLEERIPADLGVSLQTIQMRPDQRLVIQLQGKNKEDVGFTARLLQEITGQTYPVENIPKHKPLLGSFRNVDSVGFGIFVDIGVEGPAKEVLIPLHTLRKQLTREKSLAIKEITHRYGLQNYLPVQIEVTKMIFEKGGIPLLEGQLATPFLDLLHTWITNGTEVLFCTGGPRQLVKRTIAKRGHSQDVVEITRLGPQETALSCKPGTTAPGISAHVGPYLPHCRFSMIRPTQVRDLWDYSPIL